VEDCRWIAGGSLMDCQWIANGSPVEWLMARVDEEFRGE